MQYRVSVTGTVDHTFTVEAEDEFDAMAIAEEEFTNEFTCVSGGLDVGFDSIEAYDPEEA
jgi:hypothetical protein